MPRVHGWTSAMTEDEPGNRPGGAPQRPQSTVAGVVLASGVVGTVLYFAHAVFVPIALAVLFALLLSAPVEALNRKGLPRSVSAILILIVFLVVVGTAVDMLWTPAQTWLQTAPRTAQIIQRKLGPVTKILDRLNAVSARANHLTEARNASPPQPAAEPPVEPHELLAQTEGALAGGIAVVILTLFLLAAGPSVWARMAASLATRVRVGTVVTVIRAIRAEVGRYYATIALINVGLGLATAGVMLALAMPTPVLWGSVAAVLNFIPYVGSTTTFAIVTIVAFVSFDGIWHVLAVPASYLALAVLEGQVVQPLFLGNRLKLNPIVVFLAVWFGGWFWGISGIVLAIPILVATKVAAEHHARGRSIVRFLSPKIPIRSNQSSFDMRRRPKSDAMATKVPLTNAVPEGPESDPRCRLPRT